LPSDTTSGGPTEFEKFIDQASGLSPIGLANTYRGVVKPRPPIYTYKDQITAMKIPTLVVVGALDAPCLNPSQFLVHTIGGARLEILPATGHSVNVEEPAIVNRLGADFVGAAESR